MSLNMSLVGQKTDPLTFAYQWKDAVLYALGVGAKIDELAFLNDADGPKVLPTFAVVPSFDALIAVTSKLGANPLMVVHGEQTVNLLRPIAPAGKLVTTAEVTGIYDKGKGALCVVKAETRDGDGEAVFENVFSIFVRGAGGFGGERGPETPKNDPPEGAEPAFSVTETTAAEQAALYRLSGDLNPLHINPQFAKMAGFDRPILHGLCTYGFAGRAVLKTLCGGDPSRFKSFSARFSGVVFPGDSLTTRGWDLGGGRFAIQTTTGDGRTVLSNSVAEVA
ncbi:MAG TPA: MaoC/PaaZ C-terminal domain-containing protein [Kofleriaceae bacterium]|nr:MaoC/PaaZ C-terminal domain-containing protein [Kofleriaceae bacterium]